MTDKVITTAISFVVSGTLGWCLNYIKNLKEKNRNQDDALKCLLRNSITRIYYVYRKDKKIPEYEKENVNYMYEQYHKMKGNSYVEQIVKEMNSWEVI